MVLGPVGSAAADPAATASTGFAVGAFGTLTHMAAATITWMMPPVVAGLLDPEGSLRLFEDATTHGVIDPLISVSPGRTGRLLSLWFPAESRCAATQASAGTDDLHRGGPRPYVGVWLVDALAPRFSRQPAGVPRAHGEPGVGGPGP